MVREFLDRLGVAYTTRRVAADPAAAAEFRRAGYRLPPVLVIGGSTVEIPADGFDLERLETLLLDAGVIEARAGCQPPRQRRGGGSCPRRADGYRGVPSPGMIVSGSGWVCNQA